MEKYLLFRDDIKAPEGVKTLQVSTDLLEIFGKALEEEKFFDSSSWFWDSIGKSKIEALKDIEPNINIQGPKNTKRTEGWDPKELE